MTGKERVYCAIKHQESDVVPFEAYLSPGHAIHFLGKKTHEIYTTPGLLPEAMIKSNRFYHADAVIARPDLYRGDEYDFVEKNPRTKTYRLGLGIIHLARNILNNLDIRDIIKAPLRRLAVETELTAHYGQIVGSQFYIISKEEGNTDFGYNMHIGISHDITHGAHGKAIVAFMPEDERQEILNRDYLCFYGDGQPVDRDVLLTELEEARASGYATDIRVTNPNIIAISSPVFDGDGIIVGCIILIGVFSRAKLKGYGEKVAHAAIDISHDLGYRHALPYA